MKAAGLSKADMTLLYTLDDFNQQAAGIRNFQQRVLGSPSASHGTDRAQEGQKADKFKILAVLNWDGGPVQTRTADLYRVKVAL